MTFNDWCKIDEYEVDVGKSLNKPREKVVSLKKMLNVIDETS